MLDLSRSSWCATMDSSIAEQAEAIRFLEQLPFISEATPHSLRLRRMLAIGGYWSQGPNIKRALTLLPGASLLLHMRSGIMVDLTLDRITRVEVAGEPVAIERDALFEISEQSIETFVAQMDQVGLTDSVLTNARNYSIRLPGLVKQSRGGAYDVGIDITSSAALMPPGDDYQFLRYHLLSFHDFEDPIELGFELRLGRKWKRILRQLRLFSQALDQAAVGVCRQLNNYRPQLYAYLQHRGSDTLRRSRREAVEQFPFLTDFLLSSDLEEAAAMRTAVDRGSALVGPRGSAIVVSRDIARAVAGKSEDDLGLKYSHDDPMHQYEIGPWRAPREFSPTSMFRSLAMVPANHRPASRLQWQVFQEMASRMKRSWYSGEVSQIGPNLLRSLAQLGWPLTILNGADEIPIDLLLEDLKDLFSVLIDGLQTAALAAVKAEQGVSLVKRNSLDAACVGEIHDLASRTGIRKLAFMIHDWHARYGLAIAAAARRQKHGPTSESLTLLLGDPIEIHGLKIVQLLTRSDFFLEGLALTHCVASHFEHGQSGNAAYFSVRAASGARISTFDLSFRGADVGLYVVLNSHRGLENNRPPREAVAAVQEFILQLQDGALRDAAISYLRGWGAERAKQGTASGGRSTETIMRAERNARRRAAREVLHDYMSKMLKNVLQQAG